MGFVSDVLGNENGIQWYYIIGLLIFLTLFIILVYRIVKIPKSKLVDYKKSIFENDNSVEKK
ncbi:MAG: hypothetical protein ACOYLE_09225 [Bacteroidales bacterium]|jgi:hypothetical protein